MLILMKPIGPEGIAAVGGGDECAPWLAPAGPRRLSGAMTKTGSTPGPAGTVSARDARAARLAAALKANLRRRKEQARGRAAEPDDPIRVDKPAASHDSARVVVDKRSG